MATDELGCRVNYNVGSVLDRTDKVWSSKSIVYYQWKIVLVCNGCNCIDIWDVAVRVTQSLDEDTLCVRLDCCLHFLKVVDVYECSLHTI